MNRNWLVGKTVIISGASGGLGFSLSRLLIEKYDCKIIGIARNEEKIKKAAASLGKKSDNFSYRIFDVTDIEAWRNLRKELEDSGTLPDILINNAGFMLPFAKFHKYSEKEIAEIINTNFTAHINATKIFIPLLEKSKTPAIVNISSAAGICAVVGESMYCATKYAMRGFTETLQQEYKNSFYIGGVYPGFIRTDILNRQNEKTKQNKLINKMMMPVEKASEKIIKRIKRRKKRIVIGADGKSMSFFSRIMPSLTPTIITKVLKASKMDMFKEVFDKE